MLRRLSKLPGIAAVAAAYLSCAVPSSAAKSQAIDERHYVKVAGIEQWIQITGDDRSNPVLLVLHGGPGATWIPWRKLFQPWERHFTLVQWDQRGAGRTFARHGAALADTITINRITEDGIELSELLKRKLDQEKIFILGHSWGSLIGVQMAARRPDLFLAYIGTGQVTNARENEVAGYEEVLRRARVAGHEEAVRELTAIGPPPYTPSLTLATERKWESFFAHESEQKFNSEEYIRQLWPADFTPTDAKARLDGFFFSNLIVFGRETMNGPFMDVDLPSTHTRLKVPVFFLQGESDSVTLTPLVRAYFDKIEAPQKKLVLLPGGHLAVMAMPEQFLSELLRVRALVPR